MPGGGKNREKTEHRNLRETASRTLSAMRIDAANTHKINEFSPSICDNLIAKKKPHWGMGTGSCVPAQSIQLTD
jgi:hypothetical protein